MKWRRISWLVLFGALFSFATCSASAEDDASLMNVTEDELVEVNPEYEGPRIEEDADDSDYDDDDDEGVSDEDVEEHDAKRILAEALARTRKARGRTLQIIKRNRVKITLAVALFAFRNELKHLLVLLFTTPTTDPETGEVLTRTVHISATSILKIVLFVDLMRRLQKGQGASNVSLLALGPQGMFLAPLLSKLMNPANTAYVPPIEQHWTFERINERYKRDALALQKALPMSTDRRKASLLARAHPSMTDTMNTTNDTVILVDWTGLTPSLSEMSSLRDQVSFVLSQYHSDESVTVLNNTTDVVAKNAFVNTTSSPLLKPRVEVVVMLESPGGSAADYGLAAQQVLRLRDDPGIKLTICVDKVAASGGYMIACCSSPGRLYAAPFAVVGSIGVIGTSININNVLQGWGVRPLVFRGGKDKAPVGLIGEVTRDGIAKVQEMVDKTHVAFKQHVAAARPVLSDRIHHIATGDVWLGRDALEVGLVDRIVSSDEYMGERLREGARVLKLVKYERPRFYLPPLAPTRPLVKSWNAMSQSLRTLFIDLPRVLSKLSTILDESEPTLVDDIGLAAAAKSLSATNVQASSATL